MPMEMIHVTTIAANFLSHMVGKFCFHNLASAAGLCLSKIILIRLPAWSIAVVQEGNFCIQLTHTDKT